MGYCCASVVCNVTAVAHRCCFLSSFCQCPESFSLLILEGGETSTLSLHILMANFPACLFFFFFKMQALDPRMNFFCSHEQPGQETMVCKKMGHLGFQVCGSLHFAARLHSTVLALPCEPRLLSTSEHLGHLLVGDQETDLDS